MSHSLDEFYAVHSKVIRRARKQHICCCCDSPIQIGHRYVIVFTVFDGESNTYKRCLRCDRIHGHLVEKGDGQTYPAEALNCGETYQDHWGEEPPEQIAALAFMLPDEAQKLLESPCPK